MIQSGTCFRPRPRRFVRHILGKNLDEGSRFVESFTLPGLTVAVVRGEGVRERGELRESRLAGPEVFSLQGGLSNLNNNLASSRKWKHSNK